MFQHVSGGTPWLAAALATALASASCWAGSSVQNGQGSASAGLRFKIVIPTVLVLDTRSGTIYSNDSRARILVGTIAAPPDSREALATGVPLVRAPRVTPSPGLHPISGAIGAGGRFVGRGLAAGEVWCVP